MDWAATLYVSHCVFACLMLGVSFAHKGYALVMACRWSAFFYLLGLLLIDTPAPEHWAIYFSLDLILVAIVLRLRAPVGAAWALTASAGVCAMNGIGAAPGLFYDRYEPIALTLNLAQVYYLAVLPRSRPRDRRLSDRLPVA